MDVASFGAACDAGRGAWPLRSTKDDGSLPLPGVGLSGAGKQNGRVAN